MTENKTMTIEETFQSIENTLEKLRDEEMSLEDSFQLYKEGMEMLKSCADKIDLVEKQVQELNGEGELHEFQ